jgi:uncharacterized protein YkwD
MSTPGAIDTNSLEQQILAETNSARTNPSAYADNMKKVYESCFEDKTYHDGSKSLLLKLPGEDVQGLNYPDEAAEFKRDLQEAIDFLKKQSALPALVWAKGLRLTADTLSSADSSQLDSSDLHKRPDGKGPGEASRAFGAGWCGENLGSGNTPFGNVSGFILDWRNGPDRGHRKNIFNASATHLGVACHFFPEVIVKEHDEQGDYENVTSAFIRCVMDFGMGWKE